MYHGQQLFPLAVVAALLYVRATAVSTSRFGSATQSSVAMCHGKQLFPLAVLAALVRAALPCVTDNSCFH